MKRTDGETKDCRGCRFWSEMIAKANGGGPVEALCLSDESSLKGKYTTGRQTCEAWKMGQYGPIDDPYEDPNELAGLYAFADATGASDWHEPDHFDFQRDSRRDDRDIHGIHD